MGARPWLIAGLALPNAAYMSSVGRLSYQHADLSILKCPRDVELITLRMDDDDQLLRARLPEIALS